MLIFFVKIDYQENGYKLIEFESLQIDKYIYWDKCKWTHKGEKTGHPSSTSTLSNMALPTHKFCGKLFLFFLRVWRKRFIYLFFNFSLFRRNPIVILMIIIICPQSLDGKKREEDIIMSNWTINCASKRQVLWCFRWDDIYYIDDTFGEKWKAMATTHIFQQPLEHVCDNVLGWYSSQIQFPVPCQSQLQKWKEIWVSLVELFEKLNEIGISKTCMYVYVLCITVTLSFCTNFF